MSNEPSIKDSRFFSDFEKAYAEFMRTKRRKEASKLNVELTILEALIQLEQEKVTN